MNVYVNIGKCKCSEDSTPLPHPYSKIIHIMLTGHVVFFSVKEVNITFVFTDKSVFVVPHYASAYPQFWSHKVTWSKSNSS